MWLLLLVVVNYFSFVVGSFCGRWKNFCLEGLEVFLFLVLVDLYSSFIICMIGFRGCISSGWVVVSLRDYRFFGWFFEGFLKF